MDAKKLYFSIEGRIGRKTFWIRGVLVLFAVQLVAVLIDALLGAMGFLMMIVVLPMIWVYIALYAKRFHDRDKSAWWTLIALVPLIGAIWIFVECGFLKGTEGANRFGEDPLV